MGLPAPSYCGNCGNCDNLLRTLAARHDWASVTGGPPVLDPKFHTGGRVGTLMYPYSYKDSFPAAPLSSKIALLLIASLALFGAAAAMKVRKEGLLAVLGLSVYVLTLFGGVALSYRGSPAARAALHDTCGRPVPVAGRLWVGTITETPAGNRGVCRASGALCSGNPPNQAATVQRPAEGGFCLPGVSHGGPDDAFLHVDPLTWGPMHYYLPEHDHFLYNADCLAAGAGPDPQKWQRSSTCTKRSGW